jgi:hypothetical protein
LERLRIAGWADLGFGLRMYKPITHGWNKKAPAEDVRRSFSAISK